MFRKPPKYNAQKTREGTPMLLASRREFRLAPAGRRPGQFCTDYSGRSILPECSHQRTSPPASPQNYGTPPQQPKAGRGLPLHPEPFDSSRCASSSRSFGMHVLSDPVRRARVQERTCTAEKGHRPACPAWSRGQLATDNAPNRFSQLQQQPGKASMLPHPHGGGLQQSHAKRLLQAPRFANGGFSLTRPPTAIKIDFRH